MLTDSSESNVIVEESCAMLLVGVDHRVSYANPLAHKLLGHEPGTLHGILMEALLLPSRRSETRNVQDVLQGQSARRWKSAFKDAAGGRVEVHVGAEPCLDYRGQVVAVKLRLERATRAGMPLTQREVEFGSGPRRIVSVSGPSASARSRPPIESAPAPPMPLASGRVPRTTAANRTPPLNAPAPAPARPGASVYASASRPPIASVAPPPLVSPLRPPPPAYPARTGLSASPSRAPQPQNKWNYQRPSEVPPTSWPVQPFRPSGPVSKAPPSAPMSKAPPSAPVSKAPPASPASKAPTAPRTEAPRAGNQTAKTARRRDTEVVLGEDGTEQLETALQLLGWLRHRVDQPESLDDVRERGRLKYVLNEATELVAQARCDARTRRI